MIGYITSLTGLLLILYSIKLAGKHDWDGDSKNFLCFFAWALFIIGPIWAISCTVHWEVVQEKHRITDINVKNKLKIIEKTEQSFREMTTSGTEVNIDMVNKDFHSTIAQQYNALDEYVTKLNEDRAGWRIKYGRRFFSHCWAKPPEDFVEIE